MSQQKHFDRQNLNLKPFNQDSPEAWIQYPATTKPTQIELNLIQSRNHKNQTISSGASAHTKLEFTSRLLRTSSQHSPSQQTEFSYDFNGSKSAVSLNQRLQTKSITKPNEKIPYQNQNACKTKINCSLKNNSTSQPLQKSKSGSANQRARKNSTIHSKNSNLSKSTINFRFPPLNSDISLSGSRWKQDQKQKSDREAFAEFNGLLSDRSSPIKHYNSVNWRDQSVQEIAKFQTAPNSQAVLVAPYHQQSSEAIFDIRTYNHNQSKNSHDFEAKRQSNSSLPQLLKISKIGVPCAEKLQYINNQSKPNMPHASADDVTYQNQSKQSTLYQSSVSTIGHPAEVNKSSENPTTLYRDITAQSYLTQKHFESFSNTHQQRSHLHAQIRQSNTPINWPEMLSVLEQQFQNRISKLRTLVPMINHQLSDDSQFVQLLGVGESSESQINKPSDEITTSIIFLEQEETIFRISRNLAIAQSDLKYVSEQSQSQTRELSECRDEIRRLQEIRITDLDQTIKSEQPDFKTQSQIYEHENKALKDQVEKLQVNLDKKRQKLQNLLNELAEQKTVLKNKYRQKIDSFCNHIPITEHERIVQSKLDEVAVQHQNYIQQMCLQIRQLESTVSSQLAENQLVQTQLIQEQLNQTRSSKNYQSSSEITEIQNKLQQCKEGLYMERQNKKTIEQQLSAANLKNQTLESQIKACEKSREKIVMLIRQLMFEFKQLKTEFCQMKNAVVQDQTHTKTVMIENSTQINAELSRQDRFMLKLYEQQRVSKQTMLQQQMDIQVMQHQVREKDQHIEFQSQQEVQLQRQLEEYKQKLRLVKKSQGDLECEHRMQIQTMSNLHNKQINELSSQITQLVSQQHSLESLIDELTQQEEQKNHNTELQVKQNKSQSRPKPYKPSKIEIEVGKCLEKVQKKKSPQKSNVSLVQSQNHNVRSIYQQQLLSARSLIFKDVERQMPSLEEYLKRNQCRPFHSFSKSFQSNSEVSIVDCTENLQNQNEINQVSSELQSSLGRSDLMRFYSDQNELNQ